MLIWTDVIQPQSINGNTDICCLIKYDYSGYRNPCDMQIVGVYDWHWMTLRWQMGHGCGVDGGPGWIWAWRCMCISLQCAANCLLTVCPSLQGETPQHPPAGRCLWDPERVLPLPWAVSPEISLWGNCFFFVCFYCTGRSVMISVVGNFSVVNTTEKLICSSS